MQLFKSFNLQDWLIKRLESLGYKETTKIQSLVIPQVLKEKTLIVRSETGSGKTHSFLVPIISKIDPSLKELQAVIVAPTKELCAQIYKFLTEIIDGTDITAKIISSSKNEEKNIQSIKTKPQIIVGTIGKLKSYFVSDSFLGVKFVKFLVLDEADMLLDSGFIGDVDELIQKFDKSQILIFSATINEKLQNILTKYIGSEFLITSDSNNYTSRNVEHFAIDIKHSDINESISKLISIKNPYIMMIFCSLKAEIDPIYEYLIQQGYLTCKLSGELSKQERKNIIKDINKAKYQFVVCSDLASRGLDIQNVDVVLSINLPNNLEYYYHRAGRTGRYDKKGESYIFYNVDSQKQLQKLLDEKLNVNFLKFDNNNLIETKPINYKKNFKNKKDDPLAKEINLIKSKYSNAKKKPGYKKKQQQEIEKVKSRHRREIIRKDIRKQREKRYKEQAVLNGRK